MLNISDYHAQLIPLAEAADTVTGTGAVNPTFPIGGAAFLKPWFDAYRAEAHGRIAHARRRRLVRRRHAADLELLRGPAGASTMMNLMGFDAEALGQPHLRPRRGSSCAAC